METDPEQHASSACGGITVKQEPVEPESNVSPHQEIEFISVKEEPPTETEPPKREIEYISVKEEPPCPQAWEEHEGHNSAYDPLSVNTEECAPPEDFIGPSTSNIDKMDDEEDEEDAVTEDGDQELKHEVESISSGSEPESTNFAGLENINNNDHGSSITKVSLAAGEGNKIQCTTNHEPTCAVKTDTKYLAHSCNICKKKFEWLCDLNEHKHVHRWEFLNSCNVCDLTFSTTVGLKIHMNVHTGNRACNKHDHDNVIKRRSYVKQRSDLQQLTQVHTDGRQHTCAECKKAYVRRIDLQRHLRLHNHKHPFICGVCKKIFKSNAILKQHSKQHSGYYPHRCGVCNKTFVKSYSLKLHSLRHTNERPYSCSICNKSFITSYELKMHSVRHTGERPYSCGVCNKRFITSSNLKSHTMLHTGERPYSCGVCNKTFAKSYNLKVHSLRHANERP